MKADEARRLTAEARSVDERQAEVALLCWHEAIIVAAKAGKTSVRECDVHKPRTTIGNLAWQAAVTQLAADGFSVSYPRTGPNESTTEVSW